MTEQRKKLNRKQRAAKRRERIAQGLPAPVATVPKVRPTPRTPTHGEIPDAVSGWVPDRPGDDPRFRIARIVVVRFDDASTQKFYQMLMRSDELKRKRELAKNKLKQIRREIREVEKKEAKQRKRQIRAVLAMLGRS
jgi:hypothetical protein